jgi:acetyl-CoA carboxylase biotin carboxylase subunit
MRRVLVANRGEIAVRVCRACREAGLECVAVYSDADKHSVYVRHADLSRRLGPAPAPDSYLAIDKIIDAARATNADAIHPGYGFLAENPEFAAACTHAGLTFIGPPADVIAQMGSKTAAREMMRRSGVPVVPGEEPTEQTDRELQAAARRVGFPLLVKASAGGGGKGMRTVRTPDALLEAVAAARREALATFGDGTLYVERLIERARHVEVQIVADHHGNVIHLFERECSAQRRHQKVIEESPSPVVTMGLRDRMGHAAVAAARACGYRNAGTVEFLLEGEGDTARFYFLEMNTRLQVEHPVTELVTGLDLVRLQLAIASGAALPWPQASLSQRGHAVQCRIYAEDPRQGFLPQAGRLLLYREPGGPGIRVDSGVVENSIVSVHYDPLLAKLIAAGETRAHAIARAQTALARFPILGVVTNVSFLERVLSHPAFQAGTIDTGFLEREHDALTSAPTTERLALAAAAAALIEPTVAEQPRAARAAASDPWVSLRGWRGV